MLVRRKLLHQVVLYIAPMISYDIARLQTLVSFHLLTTNPQSQFQKTLAFYFLGSLSMTQAYKTQVPNPHIFGILHSMSIQFGVLPIALQQTQVP